jgi:hypothetical protein
MEMELDPLVEMKQIAGDSEMLLYVRTGGGLVGVRRWWWSWWR